jgi:hypothetical protein
MVTPQLSLRRLCDKSVKQAELDRKPSQKRGARGRAIKRRGLSYSSIDVSLSAVLLAVT